MEANSLEPKFKSVKAVVTGQDNAYFLTTSYIHRHKGWTKHELHLSSNIWEANDSPKSLQMVILAMKLKDAYSLDGKL